MSGCVWERRRAKKEKGEGRIGKESWKECVRKRDGIRKRKDEDRVRQNEIGM